MIKIYLLI